MVENLFLAKEYINNLVQKIGNVTYVVRFKKLFFDDTFV